LRGRGKHPRQRRQHLAGQGADERRPGAVQPLSPVLQYGAVTAGVGRPISSSNSCRFLLAAVLLAEACTGNWHAPSGATPPAPALSVTCPAPVTTASQTGAPIAIRYASAIASGGTPPAQVSCAPANDSL